MIRFIQNNKGIFFGICIGVGVGTAVCFINYKLFRQNELSILAAKLEKLNREFEVLKSSVNLKSTANSGENTSTITNSNNLSGFYSVYPSSEDEDEFEEAHEDKIASLENLQSALSNGSIHTKESDSVDFKKIDKLLDGSDDEKREAYKILTDKFSIMQEEASFLWRYAKATYCISQQSAENGDKESKKDLIYRSKELATMALSINDNDANVHKWCAITLGSTNDYESPQIKITNGFKFKSHIEKAIEINPEDASSYYLLGRWCFGVYMLTWIERRLAATLFATPPVATIDEALSLFIKAEKLSCGKWKENLLFIGKCYIEKKEYSDAVKWLDKSMALKCVSQDDRTAHEEIKQLLTKYGSYR